MIPWLILNATIHSGDIMVTLDHWSVYSLSRCVHTLDQVELDSQHCHSVVEWWILWFPRFYTLARCRVGRCLSFRPRSLKTTRGLGFCGMWRRSPTTTYVHLVQCSELLRLWSPLVREFLRIGSRQHWLGYLRENGLSRIVPCSARIIDRSPSFWSSSSRKCCH